VAYFSLLINKRNVSFTLTLCVPFCIGYCRIASLDLNLTLFGSWLISLLCFCGVSSIFLYYCHYLDLQLKRGRRLKQKLEMVHLSYVDTLKKCAHTHIQYAGIHITLTFRL